MLFPGISSFTFMIKPVKLVIKTDLNSNMLKMLFIQNKCYKITETLMLPMIGTQEILGL